MHATPAGTQEATVGILRSLFPPWLPPAFAVMFSRPMPGLSCQVGLAAAMQRFSTMGGGACKLANICGLSWLDAWACTFSVAVVVRVG